MVEPVSRSFGPVTVYFGEKNGKYPDGNQVVVEGTAGRAVFDTPLCAIDLGGRIAGADLAILGHVHEDHMCALHLLPEAQVYAPEADLEAVRSWEGLRAHYGYSPEIEDKMLDYVREQFHFQPRPDARGYPDGFQWDLGGVTVRAVHMPGHTAGHTVLLVEPGAIAFIGDIDLSGFGPYYGDACSDMLDFLDSMERLERLEARVWITSHHKGAITERELFLALLRKFRHRVREREEDICRTLGRGPMTLEQLVAHRFLYPKDFDALFVDDVERKTLREHLAQLIGEGRVAEEGSRYRLVKPA